MFRAGDDSAIRRSDEEICLPPSHKNLISRSFEAQVFRVCRLEMEILHRLFWCGLFSERAL